MRNYFNKTFSKCTLLWVIVTFCSNVITPSSAFGQSVSSEVFALPPAGSMLALSDSFMPTVIKGLKVYPDDPLKFDFIVDTQDSGLFGKDLQAESNNLIKYFLTTLTVPNKDLWVNLSPYEKDRIMAEGLGTTQMGRDLLAQDYLLKQITSSLMYPEKAIGEKFWEKIYATALEKYHTTDIPIDTFNKVWIVPSKAVIYQNAEQNTVYVVDAKLKVMLEEDYLAKNAQGGNALEKNSNPPESAQLTSKVMREIIIPALEKEVNEGAHFALLRQIYHSMILAAWYKRNLKESLLAKAYVGKNKVLGVDIADKEMKQKIYAQYLKAFQVGVYNYIKEEYDLGTQSIIPRKYFSGGVAVMDVESIIEETNDFAIVSEPGRNHNFVVSANIIPKREDVVNQLEPKEDNAMRVSKEEKSRLLLPSMPGLDSVLNQPVFPDKFDRELMSYLEDEVTLDNGVEIALNWIGIHDGIRIDFIPRVDFNELKNLVSSTKGKTVQQPSEYKPFYKYEELDSISYTLPEDVSVNEIRYFIQEINSLIGNDSQSLQLTEESSQRFQNMAVFLAKQNIIDQIKEEAIRQQYQQNVELLYYLGGLLRKEEDSKRLKFQDIKNLSLDFQDGYAVSDFIEKLKHFLKLSEHKLQDIDAMTWWTKNSLQYIRAMFAIAIHEKFEYSIFKKGTEELQRMGTKKSGLYTVKGDEAETEDETLWSKLPFKEWKGLFALRNKQQEEQIVYQIQERVTQYKGWVDPHKTDYAPFYIKHAQEMNCLGRCTLIARILKEIGFDEDRIFLGTYQGHAFLLLELADGSYFNIQTYRDPSKKTKEIPEEVLHKHFLSEILSEKRSAFLQLPKKMITADSPLDSSFTVHRITEGLMSLIKVSLLWDIYYQRLKVHPEDKLELLDFVIYGFERILLFEPNDYHSIANLALSYKRKSDAVYEKDERIGGLKVAIRYLEQAIHYQEMVLQFEPDSKEKNKTLDVYLNLEDKYERELKEKEKSYAVNLSFIDRQLKGIPDLDEGTRKKFSQYLIDRGLYKYENLIRLFNEPTIEFLLSDPSVKPVFLEVLDSKHREEIIPYDPEGLKQIGNGSLKQGLALLNDLVSFRVGLPSDADYLLSLHKKKKIVVGIASKTTAVAKRMNPHGRQSFIILKDGTLLGLKGSGQNLDEEASSIEWDEVKQRYSGIMSFWEAQNAQTSLDDFKGTNARLMQYLGYARIHAVPERNGAAESIDDLLYEGKILYKPAIGIYRVATPHRLSELRRLLTLDPDLRNTRKNISKALVSLGRLPQGTELSGPEFITNMMQGFGETEGYKQNKGWIKDTFHQQDLLLSGDESDNEEFIKNEDPVLQLMQLRQKVIALATMVSSIRMQEERTNQKTSLLPEQDSAYLALKTLMSAYFKALEKKHLALWTREKYKKEEVNPWDIVFSGFATERFYVQPTSATSKEMMEKKLFKDMKKWAQEALSEKDQITQDYAQVADPNIRRFFHATDIHDLVRMMRIGKIPALENGKGHKRVYLNGVYAASPGYFGNIIFYIDREGLDEKGITIYTIEGRPYFESRGDIPLSLMTRVEYARIFRDPLLIWEIDKEANRLGVASEPEFLKSRDIMMDLIFPGLTPQQREERLARLNEDSEETMEDIIKRLPSEVGVIGLDAPITKETLAALLDTGHVRYVDSDFYLSAETGSLLQGQQQAVKGEVSSGNTIYKKELSLFTQLTPKQFKHRFIRYLMQDEAVSLSDYEIERIVQFADALKDTKKYNKVAVATTLWELKNALMKKEDYPYVAYDAAYQAQRILAARGFKARLIESTNKEERANYYFVEVELLGKTLIVDLTADQFEITKKVDFSKLIFKPEFRDLGIVILPKELVEKEGYKDLLPMYTSWEQREIETDNALTTDKTKERVGGIDFNPDQLEIESQGGPIHFNKDLILKNMDQIKGFSPVIFQIVPVTNLPLLLGVKDKENKNQGVEKMAGL